MQVSEELIKDSKGNFRAEAEDRDPQPERATQLAAQRRSLQEVLDCDKEELEKDGRERELTSKQEQAEDV